MRCLLPEDFFFVDDSMINMLYFLFYDALQQPLAGIFQ